MQSLFSLYSVSLLHPRIVGTNWDDCLVHRQPFFLLVTALLLQTLRWSCDPAHHKSLFPSPDRPQGWTHACKLGQSESFPVIFFFPQTAVESSLHSHVPGLKRYNPGAVNSHIPLTGGKSVCNKGEWSQGARRIRAERYRKNIVDFCVPGSRFWGPWLCPGL